MSINQENKKGGNKRGLIIAFIIILLGINGVQLWLNLSKTKEIEKKDLTITEQKTEISNKTKELDKVLQDLEAKKKELAKLGGDTTALGMQIRQLRVERNQFAKESRLNKKRYEEMLARIEEANLLKNKAEADVTYWKKIAEHLDVTNRELKVQQEQFIDSLKQLNLTKTKLAEKVAIASVLKAENIRVEAISNKGKVKDGNEFKSKNIERLRIIFNLAENKVAQIENKVIYLRVNEPNGSTLYDESLGGGIFTAENRQIPYTLKTDVLFNNQSPEGAFLYFKGSPFKIGNYSIDLYSDGQKIGTTRFIVK